MPSFQQLNYCKSCKKHVSLNEKGHCLICESAQIKKTWSVRFRIIESKGLEIQKRLTGFETKKAAQNGYIEFINNYQQKDIKKEDGILFATLFNEFKNYQKSRIKESSYYDFCSKAELHILPHFENMLISNITPKIILDWQNTLEKYSYKYKCNLRTYLNSILNYAEKYYDVENKIRKVDGFRKVNTKKEMLFWTPEEFNKFIQEVNKEEYKAFFYALYYTGARKGELLATSWNDWDLDKGVLKINKTLTKKVYGVTYNITSPKNESSNRTITLPTFLIDIMKSFKIGKEKNKFVFYGDKPLADSSTERVQNDACFKSGVKKIRIHDFRHSHASLLISNGSSIVAVAKRLGHSNIEQTLNTYSHLMPKEDEFLVNVLQKIGSNV